MHVSIRQDPTLPTDIEQTIKLDRLIFFFDIFSVYTYDYDF